LWTTAVQRISVGAGFVREDVSALSFGDPIDEKRDILTLRVQNEIGSGRHRAVVGASWSDYDGFGTRWDGSLDYGFDLTASARLVASAGTGFRAPDATDRFGFGGNADLEPERARNYELGWQQRLGDAHRIDLRLFRSDVDDLINLACDETFNCTAVNVDRYRNDGIELSYHLRTAQWSATLTGLAQDPVDRSSDSQLLRRAKRSLRTTQPARWPSLGHCDRAAAARRERARQELPDRVRLQPARRLGLHRPAAQSVGACYAAAAQGRRSH
jgi:vitamin B12 transporter